MELNRIGDCLPENIRIHGDSPFSERTRSDIFCEPGSLRTSGDAIRQNQSARQIVAGINHDRHRKEHPLAEWCSEVVSTSLMCLCQYVGCAKELLRGAPKSYTSCTVEQCPAFLADEEIIDWLKIGAIANAAYRGLEY